MDDNEVVMTPVRDILANVKGSCDFGPVIDYPGDDMDERRTNFWIEVITSKASDTGFGHLVESILEHGFDPTAPAGWLDGRINEGHHRIVAAILLCMDEIPTSVWSRAGRFDKKPIDGMRGYFSAHRCNGRNEYPIEVEL